MTNKKKAFISVPMKGRTKEEIENTITDMKNIAKEKIGGDIEFINTIVQDKPPYETNNQAIWYLGKSIELLSQCEIFVCLKNIENYNGCFIEKEVAKRYGLSVIEIEGGKYE